MTDTSTEADPWQEATPEELDDLQADAVDHLVENLRLDQRATWVAGGVLVVLGLAVGAWWGVFLGSLVITMLLWRTRAFTAYARGDVTRGLLIVTAGTWAVTVPVVWIIPEAFPIMVLNLMGPQMVASIFQPPHVVRRLIWAGVGLAMVLGVLAFFQEGADLDEYVPEWVFNVVIIGYLAAHVVLITVDIRESNRVRLVAVRRLSKVNRDLREADRALRESRRRLVTAADEERIRIERDLHDGAQQRLVALAVQLDLAAQLVERGTPATPERLREMHVATLDAVEELRELARGVYPAVLAERGLVDALRAVARRSPQTVVVDGPDRLDLDPADEVAVYFVVLEALQNAAKHAGDGARVAVTVGHGDGTTTVTVDDDGPGFDPAATAGSRGVQNMHDRIAAIGGELRIGPAPGGGTRVEVGLPDPVTVAGASPPG